MEVNFDESVSGDKEYDMNLDYKGFFSFTIPGNAPKGKTLAYLNTMHLDVGIEFQSDIKNVQEFIVEQLKLHFESTSDGMDITNYFTSVGLAVYSPGDPFDLPGDSDVAIKFYDEDELWPGYAQTMVKSRPKKIKNKSECADEMRQLIGKVKSRLTRQMERIVIFQMKMDFYHKCLKMKLSQS